MKRKKVLVVDDELDVVEMMSRKLERANYQPYVAFNGREGLDVSQNQDVDVILTDIVMPGMDGRQFVKRLKAVERTSDIPVVVFTAYPGRAAEFFQMGVNDFVVKPFGGQHMLDVIERATHRLKRQVLSGKVIVQGQNAQKVGGIFQSVLDPRGTLQVRVTDNDYDFVTETLRQRPSVVLIEAGCDPASVERKIRILRSYPLLREVAICVYAYCGRVIAADEARMRKMMKLKQRCLKAGVTHFIDQLTPETLLDVLQECGCGKE